MKEKDLGVIMSSDLKPSAQCVAAANKGMSALRQATRTFKHINIDSFKILYKTYIRPNLEFCISAWCPYMSKDIDVMEKVQRRATRMVPELKHLKYEDRLKKLEIYHLSARRLRGDLIETYKLLNNFTDVPFERFFKKSSYLSTRCANSCKLEKPSFTKGLQCRVNFFSYRVINAWNKLPEYPVRNRLRE